MRDAVVILVGVFCVGLALLMLASKLEARSNQPVAVNNKVVEVTDQKGLDTAAIVNWCALTGTTDKGDYIVDCGKAKWIIAKDQYEYYIQE